MPRRPNVLWIMSDQHNAGCTGFAGHPDVRTPALDRIAASGVVCERAYCNNPICAPSRISFITGQYCHTHRIFSNDNRQYDTPNPDTLSSLFRRYGYQTALVGKSHMVPRWDRDGFEHIRYCDLIDASPADPLTNHYFAYLDELGLADCYEYGTAKPGQPGVDDGSAPALLPYEHSVEAWTGREARSFLETRDGSRPFFMQMSFERPHAPMTPAAEHFDMYDPASLTLPESASDWFENGFAGKPEFMVETLRGGHPYPLADADENRLRRVLASYYALISEIDTEIGRVLDLLEAQGELDNTIVFYTADHGDFAGEHGLFHKNFGIYESIHRIPFVVSRPGGPAGATRRGIVESVDWYPTVCGLCDVPVPGGLDGVDIQPVLDDDAEGKDAAWCEWTGHGGKCSAVRTRDHRLVHYSAQPDGELYDHRDDPGEVRNLWSDPASAGVRLELTEKLLDFTLGYAVEDTSGLPVRYMPTHLVQFGTRYWSDLQKTWHEPTSWPPPGTTADTGESS